MRCGDEWKDRWISPKQYDPSIFLKLGTSKWHDHTRQIKISKSRTWEIQIVKLAKYNVISISSLNAQ